MPLPPGSFPHPSPETTPAADQQTLTKSLTLFKTLSTPEIPLSIQPTGLQAPCPVQLQSVLRPCELKGLQFGPTEHHSLATRPRGFLLPPLESGSPGLPERQVAASTASISSLMTKAHIRQRSISDPRKGRGRICCPGSCPALQSKQDFRAG